MNVDFSGFADILQELRPGYLAGAADRLSAIEQGVEAVRAGRMAAPDMLLVLRREAHNLKGSGGSFGFHFVSLAAHRLEDYLAHCPSIGEAELANILVFADRMSEVVERGDNPNDEDTARILRALPHYRAFDIGDVVAQDAEVLLLAGSRTMARAVADEVRACGFRVITVFEPFEALAMAVRTRPDMVITSAVLGGISGIDVTRALRAIAATRHLPIALLTSFARNHPTLHDLPEDVPLLRLGEALRDDLGEALARLPIG